MLIIEVLTKLKKFQFKDKLFSNFLVIDKELNKRQLSENESIVITISSEDFSREYFYPLFEDEENAFIELIDKKEDYDLDIKLLKDGEFSGAYFGKLNYDPVYHGNKEEIIFYIFESDEKLNSAESFSNFYNNIVVPQANTFKPIMLDK